LSPATAPEFVEAQIELLKDNLAMGGAVFDFEAAMFDAESVERLVLTGYRLDEVQTGGPNRAAKGGGGASGGRARPPLRLPAPRGEANR